MEILDFRSDTLTQPTAEMLDYMCHAPVGDDGRGDGEDPTVLQTQQWVAELLGKEAALFVPSGTMGNNICGCTHCPRGSQIAIAENMHAYRSEQALFSPDYFGRQAVLLPQQHGIYHLHNLEAALKGGDISLLWLENTYNFEGGRVLSPADLQNTIQLCRHYHVPIHLDGARIFNAAVSLNLDIKTLTQDADSVMFCVSKGLSAPVGSFIAGSAAFISCARQIRKYMGGQLRQAGILAAAGRYALEHLTQQLEDDHRRADTLAAGLASCPGLFVDWGGVRSNIVNAAILTGEDARLWLRRLKEEAGVLAHYIDPRTVRFVTYRSITDRQIDAGIARIQNFCRFD